MKSLPLVLATAILGLSACKTTPSLAPADPSYSTDVQSIFNGNCIGCHGNNSPAAGYSLTSRAGALGAGSDSIPNVIAGDAGSSKLYRKLTGVETPRMPLGRPALDTVKTATIRNWIDKGAKDN